MPRSPSSDDEGGFALGLQLAAVGKETDPILLDASALLALLQGEQGADIVLAALPVGQISAANLSEVIAKLVNNGVPFKAARDAVLSFDLDVLPVTEEIAVAASELMSVGKPLGLSLGDRICLATSRTQGIQVLTTDSQWANLPKTYKVRLIR